MDITTLIPSTLWILVVALFVLGEIIKGTETIPNRFIPTILVVVAMAFSCFIDGFCANSMLQGILATGVAVFANEEIKQLIRRD
jgi:hypothetical protein